MKKQFKLMASSAVTIHPVEVSALQWLGIQAKWTGKCVITRKSSKLFDLHIEGKHTAYGKPMNFESWFPLACLHAWWGDDKWGRYLPAFDDWSQIRDMPQQTKWAYFNDIVQFALIEQAAKPKAPIFEYRKGLWMCKPDEFIRKKGRRGVTTKCKIYFAKTGEYAATLEDTPEEIVARVDVVPAFHKKLVRAARKHPTVSFHYSNQYALSEFLRDFTMDADNEWVKQAKN